MDLSQRILGAILIIFLLSAASVGSRIQVHAGPDTDEPHPTAIGEPVRTSTPTGTDNPQLPVEDDPVNHVATNLDHQAYLPVVSNHTLLPEAQRVIDLVNAERSSAGCTPLAVSFQLAAAAQRHSEDMALNDFFSHTSSDGRSPWDRIRETGYRFSSAAENIAAGYPSADSAVAAWMNSSGHRANILNCRLLEIGVGYIYHQNDTGQLNYRSYWTQAFATPAD